MKERNHAFDLICGLCIITVVVVHAVQFCGLDKEDWWRSLMAWAYAFMTFFFYKAGYFYKPVKLCVGEYLKERTKRLLVPYLCNGIIGLVVFFSFYPVLTTRYGQFPEPLYVGHAWHTSGFYGNQPMWFLFSFFVMYLIVYGLEHGVAKTGWVGRFLLGITVCAFPFLSYYLYTIGNPLWLNMNNMPMALFFFYLGKWSHASFDRLGNKRAFVLSLVMFCAFIVLNIQFPSVFFMAGNRFHGSFVPFILKTTLLVCGSSGLLLAIKPPRIPVLSFIGEHSMVFYLAHYPLFYIYKFTHLAFGRSVYGHPDDVLIMVPVAFVVCAWLVPYVEQIPLLSGKWRHESCLKIK